MHADKHVAGIVAARSALLVLLALAGPAAVPAAAQFNGFTWTLNSAAGGSGSTSGDSMHLLGPDFGFSGGCPNGHTISFTTTAPYDGTVVVKADFSDHDKGGNADFGVTVLNGVETKIFQECFDCDLVFDVPAGATFGFGVQSLDCIFGPGEFNLNGLKFIPHEVAPDVAGVQAGGAFGASVAGAGVLAGDSVPDLVVGAPLTDTPAADAGRAYLMSGANGAVLRTFNGTQANEHLGATVAGGGDADDDGTPDVLISSPLFDSGGADAGLVRVVSGLDGHLIRSLAWNIHGDQFGTAAAFTGDLDGDGRDDVIVGAPFSDAGGADAGLALAISSGTGATLLTLTGSAPGDRFGSSAAGLGDVNGDSTPDLAIGAPRSDDVGADAGSVRIVSGLDGSTLLVLHAGAPGPVSAGMHFGQALAAAGDIDHDGTPDVIVGAPDSTSAGVLQSGSAWVLSGATGALLQVYVGGNLADELGASVAAAGDVDGDGWGDLTVGGPSPLQAGIAWIFSGRTAVVLGAVSGTTLADTLGTAVAGVGDVDADGRADVLVGAPGADVASTNGGRAFVMKAKLLWSYEGGSVAGAHGAPVLEPQGLIIGGSPFKLILSKALENVSATYVLGLGLLGVPFKGGVMVPTVDALFSGLPTGAGGGLTLTTHWPSGLPSGFSLYLQAWLPDGAATQGLAASQGLKITTP